MYYGDDARMTHPLPPARMTHPPPPARMTHPPPPASGREYINSGKEKRGESPLLHTTELVSLRYRSVVGVHETLSVEGARNQRHVAAKSRPPPRRGAPGCSANRWPSAYSSLDFCAARERKIGRRNYTMQRGAQGQC
jgi:hypothetical protein